MMSDVESDMLCCASCGIAEVDDVKLKKCACKYVRYCSVKCQKNHRPQHKKECTKRVADLRDKILFKQPERSHHGDCPICMLPFQLDTMKASVTTCCSKKICIGCNYAYCFKKKEGVIVAIDDITCPFCRHPKPSSEEETEKNIMKRVESNDQAALLQMGMHLNKRGDYKSAIKYYKKAAEFGDADAHYNLSAMYKNGEGVEKDDKKKVYHLEEAAIGGHPDARAMLGAIEGHNGNVERSVKHFIIGAKLGHDFSLEMVKLRYQNGSVSKEDFASALRAHQAAMDATKSTQRDEGEAAQIH